MTAGQNQVIKSLNSSKMLQSILKILMYSINDIYNSEIIDSDMQQQGQKQQKQQQKQQRDMEYPHIPIEMFRIFMKQQKQFYVGEDKNILRFLFQGIAFETSLTPFEKQKNLEFQEYINKNKKNLPMDVLSDPFWTNSWKFRWLISEQYDFKNTIKAIEKHSQYLKQNRSQPSANSIKFLKQGVLYVCGRDAYYRPIFIFDIGKVVETKITEEQLLECQKFFFQKILNSYSLPGQVQSWIGIIDIAYLNLFSSLSIIKNSIQFLSVTFRSRMKALYVIKCPKSINILQSIIKKFVNEQSISKVNFLYTQKIPPLMEYANPSQIQQKYGGIKPNMTQYWPLKHFWEENTQYGHPNIKLNFISKQQYNKLYYSGKLKEHIISKVLIDEKIQQSLSQQNFKQQKIPQAIPNIIIPQVIRWELFFKRIKQ